MRGRRPEADPRFTPHVSGFLGAGRERCRWSRIVRRSGTVNVGQAHGRVLVDPAFDDDYSFITITDV